jgi:hypothetical protein
MPKATKLKSPKQTGVKQSAIHDRRATELPKDAMVAPVEIDDPFEKGAKIIAFRSIRGTLENLHARGQIDEAQYKAGRQMQTFYEQSEIGGVRAIDPAKEAVDGGRMAETLTEQVQRAIQEVLRLEKALGQEGAALCRHVLCNGFSIKQCASIRGMESAHYTNYVGARFREVLETLAVELELVSR